ncbi:oxidoreductase, partial [Rhizodiscina lignyota]
TGGADGFGSAIVDRFSKEGCKVIFLDLDKVKGPAKAQSNSNLHFIFGNVARRECWQEALDFAKKQYGRLDVVVNNAGTDNPHLMHTKSIELYEKVFDVNVKSVFLSAQVICPFMLEQGSGAFINITSTGCTRPRPGFAFYNASKAAVHLASKTMALEYAPTIRFNCICPAVGNTAMQKSIGNDDQSAERLRKLEMMLPMGRVTEPEDIANAAWYLGSEQSSFVTGTMLEVDGGRGV